MFQHFRVIKWVPLPALTGALGLSSLLGCSGEGSTRPIPVARLEVTPALVAVRVAESRVLTARALSAAGTELSGVRIAWRSADPAIASVGDAGLLLGVAPGRTTVTASAAGVEATASVDVSLMPVARLLLDPGPVEILEGTSTTLHALPVDSAGTRAEGWTPEWSVADTSIARVSPGGALTALRSGTTSLRVRADTVRAERVLRVRSSIDVAVSSLTFTQVVQNDSGSVPMILGGGLPVAASVYLTADAPISVAVWVRARCYSGPALRWEDSVRVEGVLPSVASAPAPAAQLVVPGNRLGLALGCVAEVDPAGEVTDVGRDNNRYPRTGTWPMTGIEVPPLDLAFVPIVLGADGGVIGDVSEANLAQYLGVVRQLLPVGRINARVIKPLATSTQFGTGGDAAWRAILRELEGKRVVDGATGHYYGVLRPGAGVTAVQFGGFGFISGWTALGVQVGWFTRESTARETVAHELGHNFGRPHAPCGGPAGPDPEYPYPNAAIGAQGWDLSATLGASPGRPRAIGSEARDIMSYCRPVWISDYTYRRMITGREVLAAASGLRGGPSLLVRGEVSGDRAALDPVFAVDVAATAQSATGVGLEVFDVTGAVVARHRAPRLASDHGGPASFVAVVAVPPGVTVGGVRVVSSGGAAAERRLDGLVAPVATRVDRRAGGTRLTWNARQAPHVLVRDAASGELRGFGSGGALDLPPGTGRVQVAFSNGWRERAPQ